MKAFVCFWCDHAGIVRAGQDAEKYNDPYRYAVPFTIKNGWATFEGLCCALPLSAAKAIIEAVQATGLKVRWERNSSGSVREVTARSKLSNRRD